MRAKQDNERVEVIRELMQLAETADTDAYLPPRRRIRMPEALPAFKGRIASIAAVAVTVSLGAALWSPGTGARTPTQVAAPATHTVSAGSHAGSWLVATGRPVDVFACNQEYTRSVSATTATGVPARSAFVTDCVKAASKRAT